MIKHVLTAAVLSVGFTAGAAHAQIATLDMNSMAQLTQLEDSVKQLQQQYQKQIEQLDAITGTSGMGSIGGNSAYDAAQKFPEQWDDVYGSSNAYSSNAEQTISSLDNEISNMTNDEAIEYTRQRSRTKSAHDRAVLQKIYDDNRQELENLSELQEEIKTATTQKEIEDLQARINVSQGTIDAQNMRLANMIGLQGSQSQMYEDQRRRAVMKGIVGDKDSMSSTNLSWGN
ncbi:type IV secretion system protein [Salinicola sp. NYA28a]